MPLKKGNTNIGAIYKGTTQIAKVYKGTTLLFENAKWLDYYFNNLYNSLIPTTIDNKAVQDKAKLTKISGNGVVENQLDEDGDFHSNDSSYYSATEPDYMSMSIANNILTCSVIQAISSGTTGNLKINTAYKGHKYLFSTLVKSTVGNNTVRIGFSINNAVEYSDFLVNQGETKLLSGIYEIVTNVTTQTAIIRFQGGHSVGNTFESYYYEIIDLTLMFGTGNEPTTLTDNRIQALLNRGYIAYNTGSYKNSKVGEIETFNTNNQLLDTITLPGLLELNGAINSHDTFEITNTGYVFMRNVGVVDLGTLNWTILMEGNFYCSRNLEWKKPANDNIIGNIVCHLYTQDTATNIQSSSHYKDKTIGLNVDPQIIVRDSAYTTTDDFKTAMAGIYAYLELATPQVITIPKKHLGCIDLGTLNWNVDTQGGKTIFNAYLSGGLGSQTSDGIANIYCSKYVSSSLNGLVSNDKQIRAFYISSSNPCQLGVYDSAYSTAADFKSAMAGQYLFYETDAEVSDLDNIAQINAGGSITSNWFSWIENQLVANGNFETNASGWGALQGTNSVSDNTLTFTAANTVTNTGCYTKVLENGTTANHKYLVSAKIKASVSTTTTRIVFDGVYNDNPIFPLTADTWLDFNRIYSVSTPNTSTGIKGYLYFYYSQSGEEVASGSTLSLKKVMCIDLTLAFGAGKEPTSVNDPRIQYIINKGFIPQDTIGNEESVAPEVLPNASFKIKCK